MLTRRRFIAGAVCPRCELMDKIVMYDNEAGVRVRECVSCGFSDALEEGAGGEELQTRVNQPRAGEMPLQHEDEVSVVRVIDPNPGARRRDH